MERRSSKQIYTKHLGFQHKITHEVLQLRSQHQQDIILRCYCYLGIGWWLKKTIETYKFMICFDFLFTCRYVDRGRVKRLKIQLVQTHCLGVKEVLRKKDMLKERQVSNALRS